MRLPDLRSTVRDVMIANLAFGILLAWIVCWEQLRVEHLREAGRGRSWWRTGTIHGLATTAPRMREL